MAARWWIYPLMTTLVVGTAYAKGPKKKKKGDEPAKPTPGWFQAEGALAACYFPPPYADMGVGDRRMARNDGLTAMMAQWRGERDDGVKFDGGLVTDIETVLLGYPDKIEGVIQANYAKCAEAMSGKGTDGWEAWLRSLPAALTKGECLRPLDVTMFWYADIGMGWQGPASICDDNVVRISASSMDYYKVDDDGDWINAAGDASRIASGNEYPCTIDGCTHGQLILRFRGDSGMELIKPVGLELIFDPPEHGQIEFMMNDTSYFNNKWKVERGVQHRTSVTYEPVE